MECRERIVRSSTFAHSLKLYAIVRMPPDSNVVAHYRFLCGGFAALLRLGQGYGKIRLLENLVGGSRYQKGATI